MGALFRGLGVLQKAWIYFLMAVFVPGLSTAQENPQPLPPADIASETAGQLAIVLDVVGPIGPATADFVTGSLEKAAARNAEVVVIRMDTPGGLDASTRDIVKAILNSPLPVATLVTPSGARAASAGTYILYASHIAAMSPATNVGAATPVSIIGGRQPGGKAESGENEEGLRT